MEQIVIGVVLLGSVALLPVGVKLIIDLEQTVGRRSAGSGKVADES